MSSFLLKISALFFMIIDHAGLILFPDNIIFRIIGRLAFPIFAYQMAIGFSHTKNREKHIIKLLLFAILTQIPHFLMVSAYSNEISLNIIFTFVTALLIIYTIENLITKNTNSTNKKNMIISTFAASLLSIFFLILGTYLNVDYSWYGILLTVCFYFTLSRKWLSCLLFFLLVTIYYICTKTIMSLLGYIALLSIPFILLFNGKKGYNKSWIFYVVYILHFFVLLALKQFI